MEYTYTIMSGGKARSKEFGLTLTRLIRPTETTPATCFTLCGDDQLCLDGDIRNTVTGDGNSPTMCMVIRRIL
jgi:hypothetical protein